MKIVYKCSYISFSTPVTINGKSQRITFKGGSYGGGMTTNAHFTTSDKQMQEQIEGSSAFKAGQIWITAQYPEPTDKSEPEGKVVDFVQPVVPNTTDEVTTDKVEDMTTDKVLAPETTTDPVTDETDTNPEGSTDKVEEGITGFQKAKNILVTKYAATFEANVTKDIVLAKAKELGVTFPNWK